LTEIFDRSALIADNRNRVLVEDAAGAYRLPRWSPSGIHYGHVVGPLNRALRREMDIEVTTLRYLGRFQASDTGRPTLVYEMEWHNRDWFPLTALRWVDRARWEALEHIAEEKPFLETWFAEAESGCLPPQRAPWAIRGWHDEAVGWISDETRRLGRPLAGRVEQERCWGISTVLRAPAAGGDLYFKASGAVFHAEPAVTKALEEIAPGRVPAVLAIDPARAWMLMADYRGRPLTGTVETAPWAEALREYARLQVTCGEHEARLRAAGIASRPLRDLPAAFAELARNDEALMVGRPAGLTPEQASEMRALVPWVEDACERLARAGIPETLLHGDLHAGNLALTGRGPVFYDWSDAAWSHPFLDLVPFFAEGFEGPGTDQAGLIRDAYLEPWTGYASPDVLHEAFDLAQAVGCAYHAVSYWTIVESLEPASRCELSNGVPWYLRLLLERRHATQR